MSVRSANIKHLYNAVRNGTATLLSNLAHLAKKAPSAVTPTGCLGGYHRILANRR
jgi:hypothetical protein